MKKNLIYILALLALFIGACDKPSPVELTTGEQQPEDPIELTILNQNPSAEMNSTEPDSGLVFIPPPDLRFGAHIVVVKSKIKDGDSVKKANLAQGIFYDLSSPVKDGSGKIVSFKTLPVQFIRFKNITAREVQHIARFRRNSQIVDTILGPKFILVRRPGQLGDPFDYEPGTVIPIDIKKHFSPAERFNVTAPPDITGEVEVITRNNGAKAFSLKWDKLNHNSIDIVLSGISLSSSRVVPLFRIRTTDDGALVIPANIMSSIPVSYFSKLVVTFIRQTESLADFPPGRIYFQIQSLDNKVISLN